MDESRDQRGAMEKEAEIDQFQLLEEKVDSLIKFVTSLKREKELLIEKVHSQESKIADLSGEVEYLRETRDKAKQRMATLLERIEQLDISF